MTVSGDAPRSWSNGFIPYPQVVEETHRGERSWDIFSRLLNDRIVFLGTEIDDGVANIVIAQFLYLESDDPQKEIVLYINSPGGSVNDGLAIYDTMQHVRCPVSTVCIGQAASMAAVLLASGAPGRRLALPNARVMIHQPEGAMSGQASDIAIQAREILRLRERLDEILVRHTGKTMAEIKTDTDRDNIMSSEEAKAYGLIDEVMVPNKASGSAHG